MLGGARRGLRRRRPALRRVLTAPGRRRALGGAGAEYLRKLDKDYKREGVYINTTPRASLCCAGTRR